MHFAFPLPWWLTVLVVAAIAGVAVFSYRRPLVPLSRAQHVVLVLLRGFALGAVAFLLCRPVLLLPPTASDDVVIPVIVDASRSMRVPDADGQSRIAEAKALLETLLVPQLSTVGRVELLAVGGALSPTSVATLDARGHRTDLSGAIVSARDRYRGRRVPGILLLSDGGDTEQRTRRALSDQGPPVFAVGIGSIEGVPDREVSAIAASDPRVDQATIDLHVSAVTRGFGRTPFQLRVLGNGQPLANRAVTPLADGSPIDETFTVSPDPAVATAYSAEIVAAEGESITENNARGVVLSPAGRKRRVLVVAGAPGYDYTFLVRALSQDPSLEVDSVVRKGENETGVDTFLVQAGGGRGPALTAGFPVSRESLFVYDAVVITNLEGDFFTRAQLGLAADFVEARGGGLLVMGGRSFEQRGFIGTPLEAVLPLELNDRRGAPPSPGTASSEEAPAPQNALTLTPEGQNHPVMRIGATPEESRKLWAALPVLAASAAVGGPRPGATVLAVTATPSGIVMPVVAVQRYGRGRSMIFSGEASWRWRMMQPSSNRSYEFFWRQALRWLTSEAPEPVTITVGGEPEPGDAITFDIDVRDRSFAPAPDAAVEATIAAPGADAKPLVLRPGGNGRFSATMIAEVAGVHRVHVEARRGAVILGAADRWVQVGAEDREFADPRLNEALLRRLARESGGKYVRAADAARIVSDLRSAVPANVQPGRRDLWHEPWAFALVLLLLSGEWLLRRTWGLR